MHITKIIKNPTPTQLNKCEEILRLKEATQILIIQKSDAYFYVYRFMPDGQMHTVHIPWHTEKIGQKNILYKIPLPFQMLKNQDDGLFKCINSAEDIISSLKQFAPNAKFYAVRPGYMPYSLV